MDKRFWAVIGVLVLIFGGVIFANKHQSSSSSSNSSAQPSAHYAGKLDSKVTLTEYGDFQCPACESFSSTTEAVRTTYQDRVRFQFRNLPLTSLHQNAFSAARAAEAAALQGKFWEMHDLLYAQSNYAAWTQASNPTKQYESYAQQLGLDLTKFTADSKSTAVNDRINADIDAFRALKVDMATPTFFLNGKKVDSNTLLDSSGRPDATAFAKILDEALAKNN